MLMMDKMKLVELYGEYKRNRVLPDNVDMYDNVVRTVVREMPRIVDPCDAIDFIDHMVDLLRWSAEPDDVQRELRDCLEFYR